MRSVPYTVDRTAGDNVSSEEFNRFSKDAYEDLRELFTRQMVSAARGEILTNMLDMTNAGIANELKNQNLPLVNYTSSFVYPTGLPACLIDTTYGEITLGIQATANILVDSTGRLRDGIRVERSQGNFMFVDDSGSALITETPVRWAVETEDLPYLIRVKDSNDTYLLGEIRIDSDVTSMDFNSVEFQPFPMVGVTQLKSVRYFDTVEGELTNIKDAGGIVSDFPGQTSDKLYFPIRLLTRPSSTRSLAFDIRSDTLLSGTIFAGINNLAVKRHTFEPISYIGFVIPSSPTEQLTGLSPVTKWHNSFLGNTYSAFVYDNPSDFDAANSSYVSVFDSQGAGSPVTITNDLYVLIKIESEKNTSVQLTGFNYTKSAV